MRQRITSGLPPGRQRELAVTGALADLDAELGRLHEALPKVNDPVLRPTLDDLAAFGTAAGEVLANRGDGVNQRLVDDLADLAGTVELVQLPSRDPELGFTPRLGEIGAAQGRCLAAPCSSSVSAIVEMASASAS